MGGEPEIDTESPTPEEAAEKAIDAGTPTELRFRVRLPAGVTCISESILAASEKLRTPPRSVELASVSDTGSVPPATTLSPAGSWRPGPAGALIACPMACKRALILVGSIPLPVPSEFEPLKKAPGAPIILSIGKKRKAGPRAPSSRALTELESRIRGIVCSSAVVAAAAVGGNASGASHGSAEMVAVP